MVERRRGIFVVQGKLAVQYPPEACDENGQFSQERLIRYYNQCARAVKAFTQELNLAVDRHRVLMLVDLQGIYLGFTRWLAAQSFPIDSGMLPSRFAHYLLEAVARRIESRIVREFDFSIVLNDLVRMAFRNEEITRPIRHVVDVQTSIELFYAPVPLAEIEWRLNKEARKGSAQARRQLDDIRRGLLKPHGDARDYAHYDGFIQCMKRRSSVSRWEEGFFNFYVDKWLGLKSFDEKEVDTRIVMRAVDACNDYEADSICIISSDQDFVPLHERGEKSGVNTYQADASKFANPEKVGRRIRELGDRFIPVGINPEWPMRAVFEACGHDPFNGVPVDDHIGKMISQREFSALCQLHNEMNDEYQLEPTETSDGERSVEVSMPTGNGPL